VPCCAVPCCADRLFAAKGYSMVNPLLPRDDSGRMALPLLQAPVPRLSQDDKWLLFKRSRKYVGRRWCVSECRAGVFFRTEHAE
jgi:hypothetical protein